VVANQESGLAVMITSLARVDNGIKNSSCLWHKDTTLLVWRVKVVSRLQDSKLVVLIYWFCFAGENGKQRILDLSPS